MRASSRARVVSACVVALSVLLLGGACATEEAKKKAEPPKPAKPAKPEPPPEPEPTFSDGVRDLARGSAKAVATCTSDYVQKVDLDLYKNGDLNIDLTKMDAACAESIAPLLRHLPRWVLLHPALDDVLFEAQRHRDAWRRVDLYLKRVGGKARSRKKNIHRLKSNSAECVAASAALKAAVGRLDGVDFEKDDKRAAAEAAFLEKTTARFDTYIEKPVKQMTAMCHGVARFLLAGAHRLNERAAKGANDARKKATQILMDELRSSKELYADFEKAARFKIRRAKTIGKAVAAVTAAGR